jgi:lactate racemase
MKTVAGIDYGIGTPWEIELPNSATVVDGVDESRIPPPLENVDSAVREAIRNPHGMKPLGDLVNSGSKVTIATNDWMGFPPGVAVVLEELQEAGVDERNIRFVIAGGLHPKVTRSELYLSKVGQFLKVPYPSPFHILPPDVVDRFWPTGWGSSRIKPHDAADAEHLVDLGVTEFGDLVEMNDCVVESDLVVYMSGWSGIPSIWGGYLGGGQGVTVGLGSGASIMTHHAFRIHEHERSMASDARKQLFMKHKESVAAFVEEATGKKIFYLECCLNVNGAFAGVFAGDGASIREPIFDFADREKIVEIPEQVDVFVTGAPHWGIFYDTVNNPLMSLVQINSRVREHVGDKPPLKEGGVAILVTPCDGTIDERWRTSDREMLQLFNRLGHDPAKLEDYEEEYAHREDLILKYRYANGAHPLHAFPVFYENSFILKQASRIIFAGARDAEGASLVGATAVPTWDEAWRLACRTIGKSEPSVFVPPNVGRRMPLLWKVADGRAGARAGAETTGTDVPTGGVL